MCVYIGKVQHLHPIPCMLLYSWVYQGDPISDSIFQMLLLVQSHWKSLYICTLICMNGLELTGASGYKICIFCLIFFLMKDNLFLRLKTVTKSVILTFNIFVFPLFPHSFILFYSYPSPDSSDTVWLHFTSSFCYLIYPSHLANLACLHQSLASLCSNPSSLFQISSPSSIWSRVPP